ncbi:NB-ARC domain-containing protein [Alkalinema sp. FACHB-956]|uniref:NB-ARC domain-containing protein n=1 Tax=Alkalinema sp. FACHB-956 TaxID=2692768 RepID=UPI001686CE6D|nr:hypothetical protein [Alkalinema sp. FACHB-956]
MKRPEALAAVKELLLRESERTLVVSAIAGLGGLGKSVLATAIVWDDEVQARFADGILWVTLGQQPDLLWELGEWIRALDKSRESWSATTLESARRYLHSLLVDKRVLLVVDDVWNAAHAKWFWVGGPECRVLVTTRGVPIIGAERYDLDVMSPEDSLTLIRKTLADKWQVEMEQPALEFAEMLGHLPLALRLMALQISRGKRWESLKQAFLKERLRCLYEAGVRLSDLSEQEQRQCSLAACFEVSLARLREDDPALYEQFVWLGVLPEDVTIQEQMAVTLWGVEDWEAEESLLSLYEQAFLMRAGESVEGYALYRMHDLMHATAQGLIESGCLAGVESLAAAHRSFVGRYGKLNAEAYLFGLPKDGYIHRHLTWHLVMAGREDTVHRLLQRSNRLGRNAWFEACEEIGEPAIFVQDVQRGWELAEALYERDNAKAIILQIRYVLIFTTLNSLLNHIPDELIAALVKHGYWQVEKGLAYAENIPENWHRGNTIIELVPYLSQTLAIKSINIAQEIDDDSIRENVLQAIARKFPELLPNIQLNKSDFPDKEVNILEHLQIDTSDGSQLAALEKIQIIVDEEDKCKAICEIAPKLKEEFLEKAVSIAYSIEHLELHIKALCRIGKHIPKIYPDLYSRILSLEPEDPSLGSGEDFALILCHAISIFPELAQKALEWSSNYLTDEFMPWAVRKIAPHIDEDDLLYEALDYIFSERDEYYYSDGLAALSPYLSPEYITIAFNRAQLIHDPGSRIAALNALVSYLPFEKLESFLSTSKQISDQYEYCYAIAYFSRKYPVLHNHMIEILKTIENELDCINTLFLLAKYLPIQYLSQIRGFIEKVHEEYEYFSLLILLAAKDSSLLQDIIRESKYLDNDDYAGIMVQLAELMPEKNNEALKAVKKIKNGYRKKLLLKRLLPCLSRKQLLSLYNRTKKGVVDEDDIEMLIEIVNFLPEKAEDLLEKIRMSFGQKTEWNWLVELAKFLPDLCLETLEKCAEPSEILSQSDTLIIYMTAFPDSLPYVMEKFPQVRWDKLNMFNLIALAKSLKAEFLPDAITAIKKLSNPQERADAYSNYLSRLSWQSMSYEEWKDILKILSSSERASFLKALPDLTPGIKTFGGEHVVEDVILTLREVYSQWP